jgi:hypothetical protein
MRRTGGLESFISTAHLRKGKVSKFASATIPLVLGNYEKLSPLRGELQDVLGLFT